MLPPKVIAQSSVAGEAGISPSFFSRILDNVQPCPPKLALKLEEVTGISIRIWLYGSKEDKRKAWKTFSTLCCEHTKKSLF